MLVRVADRVLVSPCEWRLFPDLSGAVTGAFRRIDGRRRRKSPRCLRMTYVAATLEALRRP